MARTIRKRKTGIKRFSAPLSVMLSKRSAALSSRGSVVLVAALLNNMVLLSPRGGTFSQTYTITPWLPQEAGKLAELSFAKFRLKRIDVL